VTGRALEDPAVVVRRLQPREAPKLVAAVQASLPDLSRYLPWAEPGYDLAAARRFIAFARAEELAGRGLHWSVFEKASGELVGGIGLMTRVFESAELGYWIRSDQSGRGLCTRAARLMLRYGFAARGLRRVWLVCEVANRASGRVARKLGMRREGRLRDYMVVRGRPRDHYLYAVLREEWEAP
jgi:ribosomal-protein-serine acetyltransferase